MDHLTGTTEPRHMMGASQSQHFVDRTESHDFPSLSTVRPSQDDDERPLLGGPGTPVLEMRISVVKLLRPFIMALTLANFALLVKNDGPADKAAAAFAMLLFFWAAFISLRDLTKSCGNRGSTDPIKIELGSMTCIFGRTGEAPVAPSEVKRYMIILVDFIFGILQLLPLIAASVEHGWYRDSGGIIALSTITL